jgi:hypothetical protein
MLFWAVSDASATVTGSGTWPANEMPRLPKMVTILGGVKGLYASIDNAPYMRLVIEDTGPGPRGYQAVAWPTISNKTATFAKTLRWL